MVVWTSETFCMTTVFCYNYGEHACWCLLCILKSLARDNIILYSLSQRQAIAIMSAKSKKSERGTLSSGSAENLSGKRPGSVKANRPSSADVSKYSARSTASLVSFAFLKFVQFSVDIDNSSLIYWVRLSLSLSKLSLQSFHPLIDL